MTLFIFSGGRAMVLLLLKAEYYRGG